MKRFSLSKLFGLDIHDDTQILSEPLDSRRFASEEEGLMAAKQIVKLKPGDIARFGSNKRRGVFLGWIGHYGMFMVYCKGELIMQHVPAPFIFIGDEPPVEMAKD